MSDRRIPFGPKGRLFLLTLGLAAALYGLPLAAQVTFSIKIRASGTEKGPAQLREFTNDNPRLDITNGFSERCTSNESAQACITDPACEIDFGRTYTTPNSRLGQGFGKGGAGYGVVLNAVLDSGSGSASYSLNTANKCLTATARVCATRRFGGGGHYNARHAVYAKCFQSQPWTQTKQYGPFQLTAADGYKQLATYDGPIGSGSGAQATVSQYTVELINVSPPGAPLQNGMFQLDPNQSAANGKDFWAKLTADNDLVPTALEVSQGIQNFANQMPLVGLRRTAVRGYLKSKLNVGGVQARLRGLRAGVDLPGSPLAPENPVQGGTTGGDRLAIQDAFLFLLPASWREGEVELRFEVDPGNLVPELDEGNNSLVRKVVFGPALTMDVTSIPLHLHLGGNPNQALRVARDTDPYFQLILSNLYRYHPIAALRYFDCGFEPVKPFGHDLLKREWQANKGLDQGLMLARVATERALSDCGSDRQFWLGLVDPAIDTNSILGIGVPFGRSAWARMDPFGYPAWSMKGGETVAHEMGHNRGLFHVSCNGEEGFPLWSGYPYSYPNCRLAGPGADAFYGLDVYYDLWSLSKPTVISNDPSASPPNQAFPFMGYRNPGWANPTAFCWMLLLEGVPCNPLAMKAAPDVALDLPSLTPAPPEDITAKRDVPVPAQPVFLVTAVFDAATRAVGELEVRVLPQPGSNALKPRPVEVQPFGPPGGGETLALVSLDRAGREVGRQTVVAGAFEGLANVRVLVESVRFDPSIAGFRLLRGTNSIVEKRASLAPPKVRLISPNAGALAAATEVRWEGSDPDGDALTYEIFYSANGGRSWRRIESDLRGNSARISARLPGSAAARLRVTASDGFWSASDDSDGTFSVAGNPPRVVIVNRDPVRVAVGGTLTLQGLASDLDQGRITDPARFRWNSSRDGDLGVGSELMTRRLSQGAHRVRLAVNDDEGKAGSAFVNVYVGVAPPSAWTAWLNVDAPGGVGDFETLEEALRRGVCSEPAAIQCRTRSGQDWTASGRVYTCDVGKGGICVNAQQRRGQTCLDFEVRYLCPAPPRVGGAADPVVPVPPAND